MGLFLCMWLFGGAWACYVYFMSNRDNGNVDIVFMFWLMVFGLLSAILSIAVLTLADNVGNKIELTPKFVGRMIDNINKWLNQL